MGKFTEKVSITVDMIRFDEELLQVGEIQLENFVEKEMDDLVDEAFIVSNDDENYRMLYAQRQLLEQSQQNKALYIRLEPQTNGYGKQEAQELFLPYGWCAVQQVNGQWEVMEKPTLNNPK